MGLLDDSDSGSETKETLKVNKKFAETFEKTARYKELQKNKELLKSGAISESDDSESETEDEDAEQLSATMDLKIIQTINSIRKKDPSIYDSSKTWFQKPAESDDGDESDSGNEGKKLKTSKKKYKDVLREQLLTHGADIEGEGAQHSKRVQDTNSKSLLSYDKEQEKIRQEFLKMASAGDKKQSKKSAKKSDDSEDGSDDDVLMVKPKTNAQLEQEERELKAALLEMKSLGEREAPKLLSKKTAVMSSSLDPSEDAESFLADYMMNRKWLDKGTKSAGAKKSLDDDSEMDVSEEDEELDKVDRFESKYNFRFEELQDSGAGVSDMQVVGHARDVAGSLRRVDDKRKKEREARLERKEKEKRQKEAELRRLKNLKRQELKERLSKIGEIAGLKKMGLDEGLLDEDWDPRAHEAMMNAQFNDEYYAAQDEGFHYQEGGENYDGGEEGGDHTNQELLAMEGYEDEYAGEEQEYGEEEEEGGEAPELNEEDVADVKHMVEELYKLDYEDIVAGIPCRFKYRQVEPEGFGLSAEDILQADDAELNKFVSLKHISAYNTKPYQRSEADVSKKRKKLRAAVKERLEREALEAEILGREVKGSKKGKKAAAEEEPEEQPQEVEEEVAAEEEPAEEGKRKRKRRKAKAPAEVEVISKKTVAPEPEAPAAGPAESEAPAGPAVDSHGNLKVGTNKERKLKVLEQKKKHRAKLVEQSKEKAAVKKAMKTASAPTPAAVSNAAKSEGAKKRLDLYN